ncbi:Hypothetical predicted protein [Olea europaea subsp. europaea]|uniref:Uncharacterized protein n=1 Tax=Olea europaea subsp. europaea TaxID=158383 RepID=A0A8S0SD52_OLEEU|nr:Hypothetical predicted protein [Olea europaea subsp. europaea]
MVKFDRASLLLALCVTVIISPYMPLSQCFYLPPKPVPPTKPLLQCANLPFKPGTPMKPLSQSANLPPIKRPEILSRKMQTWKNLFNEIAENVCDPKQEIWKNQIIKIAENICNPMQEVLLRSDITDAVGYLYDKEPDFRSFQKRICKDVETPSPKIKKSNYPPTSEEERQLEDEFLRRRVRERVENDDDEVSNIYRRDDTTHNKRQRKELKIGENEKLEECIMQWSSTISMTNEETEHRMLYLKEKLAHIQEKSSNHEGTSEVTSLDPYSYMECLNILNNMEGVSNEIYMKTIKAFKDSDFRITFVMMPKIRRGHILELL